MRGAAVVFGGLLVIGGAVLVVVADQQRVDALDDARTAVVEAREQLDAAREANLVLAEKLTGLRSHISEQDAQLRDDAGFLR
jgi:F0F1-type ATP synthase delta subunit